MASFLRTSPALPCWAAGLFVAVMVSGCAIQPKPLTSDESRAFAHDIASRMLADQEPVRGPIDLYEAMARALKYNLDAKVEVAQRAVKLKELDLSNFRLLPNAVVNAGFAGRDNTLASASESILTGRQSLEPSRSSERTNFVDDLTLSWNVLDYGLSYVRAQQTADEALIAEEMRRKIANRVIEDVRTAYWRAVTSERLLARTRLLEARTKKALGVAKQLYNDQQTSPVTALTYERELVEIQRETQRIQGELTVAKTQLAALMNLSPGQAYTLVHGNGRAARIKLNQRPDLMVATAFENRPEMKEIQYKLRINSKEMTAALLELLPSINLYLGANSDQNKFLFHNDWVSWGAKASWNLMKVFQLPARQDLIDSQAALLDQRALALGMAITTQVQVASARYIHAAKELETARRYADVQCRLLKQFRAQAATDRLSEQTLVREEMNALVAEVKHDLAYAGLQNAFATIYSAQGLDPITASVDLRGDVKSLAAALRRVWQARGDGGGIGSVAGRCAAPTRLAQPSATITGSITAPAEPAPYPPGYLPPHMSAPAKAP